MSRFDVRGPADSYLRGAGLGSQQFDLIASLFGRQREQDWREEVWREQAPYRQAQLDEMLQQYGIRRDNAARASTRWEQEQQAFAQEQERNQAFRAYLRQRVEQASGGGSPVPAGGVGMAPMGGAPRPGEGRGYGVLAPEAATPGQQAFPASRALLDFIDNADPKDLKELLPYVDSVEKHTEVERIIRQLGEEFGGSGWIFDTRTDDGRKYQSLWRIGQAMRDPGMLMKSATQAIDRSIAESRAKSQLEQMPDLLRGLVGTLDPQNVERVATALASSRARTVADQEAENARFEATFEEDVTDYMTRHPRATREQAEAFIRGRNRRLVNQDRGSVSERDPEFEQAVLDLKRAQDLVAPYRDQIGQDVFAKAPAGYVENLRAAEERYLRLQNARARAAEPSSEQQPSAQNQQELRSIARTALADLTKKLKRAPTEAELAAEVRKRLPPR